MIYFKNYCNKYNIFAIAEVQMIQAEVSRNEIIRFVREAKSAGSGYVQTETATDFSQK
ncbi:MAG: hypothetical protein ACPL1K_02480 [Candidatus Kryptoniota bacterium]